MEFKEQTEANERGLDSQLWHACAGSMVRMLPMNTKVFYFPQGHAEHAGGKVDFSTCPRIPSCVPCRVSGVKFMAEHETDEVFAKIQLVPVSRDNIDVDVDFDDDDDVFDRNGRPENPDKPTSFAKTLTQSDANNGGGFSVPRYCAETLFPRLDYTADPPVQTILAKDVHGETWKFRHIYRGTPRRHLLTTGWSAFVNHKKLVAGDSIVFLRAENGDLCIGIRRAKRELGGNSGMFGAFSSFLMENEDKFGRNGNQNPGRNGNQNPGVGSTGQGKVTVESVIEAVTRAANGQLFEVVYYPRASTPEFCVKASLVRRAMQNRWYSGMRFKMAFETEDSSRISCFVGTITAAQVVDPFHWPDSPWRLLKVTWDEPDLLQSVKRINPWLVESVSDMSTIHLSPFSPPRKKLRLPQNPEFPLIGQFPVPAFSGGQFHLDHFSYLPDNTPPAGMQGARHAQYGLSLQGLHSTKLQSGFHSVGFQPLDQTIIPNRSLFNQSTTNLFNNEKVRNSDDGKGAPFVLFGQRIFTEQQISQSNSNKTGNTFDGSGRGSSLSKVLQPEVDLESSHCKVFMESEDVGRTVNLSLLTSYEELCRKLASMFDVDRSEILNHVIYHDAMGKVRQLGNEPFSQFVKSARRLRILTDSSSDDVGM